MGIPPAPPFRLPQNRSRVTREPDEQGKWTPQFPDDLGHRQFGGGKVPEDFGWRSNPKEWQEELSDAELRRQAASRGAAGPEGELPSLPAAAELPRLPPGEKR